MPILRDNIPPEVARIFGIETLVEMGERHGMLYDAFGDEGNLNMAVLCEKAAFELQRANKAVTSMRHWV